MHIRLKGFQIQNYKIINDSGYCSVNEQLTTLIGKNESGKTIILEALKNFNLNINISEEYRPEIQHSFETIITNSFEVSSELINDIFQSIGHSKHFFHSVVIKIRKHYPNIYRLDPELKKEWFPQENEKEILFLNQILPLLPYFCFLESSDNTFPPRIDLEATREHWYLSLREISDFSETITSKVLPIKNTFTTLDDLDRSQLKKINIVNIPECQKFYDLILDHLYYIRQGNQITFIVQDNNVFYELEKLNRLQKWYLSFYLKAAHALITHTNSVFLIDEPGVLVHSHSQIRLLSKLEQFSIRHQMIFTTHSPYLIDSEKIHRIRLVEKTIDGTRLVERIYRVNDIETLSPVMTAIGINASPINNINRQRNVIVEGTSDLYYMEAFKKLIEEDTIHFIFGGGAGNMSKVGTILRGWGCDLLYLYDNDKGGIDAEKNLKKYWLFGDRDVVYVVEPEGTVEDIFHPEDFRKIILEKSEPYSESNSDYIKKNNINKVACALKFKEYLEITKNVKLHSNTIKNVQRLFQVITERFEVLEKIHLRKLSKEKTSITTS